jgi:hypothetical protein
LGFFWGDGTAGHRLSDPANPHETRVMAHRDESARPCVIRFAPRHAKGSSNNSPPMRAAGPVIRRNCAVGCGRPSVAARAARR